MIQSFKKRLIIEIAISFGVIAVIVMVLVSLGNNISAKAESISRANSERNNSIKIDRDFAALTISSKGTEVMMEKLNNALPAQAGMIEVIQDVGALAKEHNLLFSSPKYVGTEIPPTDTEPGRIKLEMTAQGSYTGIVRFIKDLETGRFFIKINNIDIIRQGFVYNAIIGGELYFK
jgi:hypothetical protein